MIAPVLSSPKPRKKYGDISSVETVGLAILVLVSPFVAFWSLLASPFAPHSKPKAWRRVLGDSAFRFVLAFANTAQLQVLLGNTRSVYESWVKQNGLQVTIEELGDGARLLWIGPKRTDRVILFCHGGGYFDPLQFYSASFWRYVQLDLAKRHLDVGLVILSYSLLPEATFPTQLRQAMLGLQHLFACGVQPQNLRITGDSAGGNLVMQILSHAIHPLDGIPPLRLASRVRGIYLMSPWASLTDDTGSRIENMKTDLFKGSNLTIWGADVLSDVPASQRAYAEASKAPDDWFKGVDKVVDRVLLTVGGAECFKDSVSAVAQTLKKHHPDVVSIVQEYGIHDDPFLNFMVGEPRIGEVTPLIIEWFAKGFNPKGFRSPLDDGIGIELS